MKKLFTLFAIMLCAVMANAQTEYYEWYVSSQSEHQSTADYFSWGADTKHNLNTNYKNATYKTLNGESITCEKGLKMEGSTEVKFSSARPATVIVVQCTSKNPDVTIKFDDEEMTDGVTDPDGCSGVKVFTMENVAAGDHAVKRGGGETGIMYVGVFLEDAKGETLAAPEITFDVTTGEVTISEVANAEKVVYTTDGSMPTADSEVYSAPFTVEDATTVKAMALGDGENTANSDVTTVEVLLEGKTVDTPVITQFNGSFMVTCDTPLATIEISLNDGDFQEYVGALTVTEDTKVIVKATRDKWTASEATADVKALPEVKSDKTIFIAYGSFESAKEMTEDGEGIFKGEAGNEARAYGFNLIRHRNDDWSGSKGNSIYLEALGTTRTGIKTAGQPLELVIPEGIKVNRLTFYSYNNYPTTNYGGWNVEGEDFTAIPTWCRSGYDKSPQNCDVRMYNFDGKEGSITFREVGDQAVFVLAVDIEEAPKTIDAPVIKHGETEIADEIVLEGEDKELVITPADEAHHIYYHFAPAEENQPQQTPEVEGPGEMTYAKATAEGDVAETLEHEGKTFTHAPEKKITLSKAGTLSILAYHPETDIKSEVKTITVSGSGTSGIADIAVDAANGAVEYFNLQGIRVDNPAEGIFIRREGNKVSKVIVK